ncbi:MAG: histidine-type phosphatase, partial [Segatella sp.]
MKRKMVILSLMTFCLSGFAQQAKQDFKANRQLSASNYLAYPGPLQKTLTPAPKGYEPFYLSHYGRHGSRWLIGKRDYQQPVKWLEMADSLGKLTPKGQEVLHKLRLLRDAAKGRDGELTQLGAEQHRQIAERMMRNFPEIFKGKTHVDAKSTVVIRCILSMENALQQLVRMNPQLDITHDASYHDMYYMNHNDTSLFK